MTDKKTGGPAFPHVNLPVPGYDPYEVRQTLTGGGMTLRDYFAAKAMQGMMADGRTGEDYVASLAYNYADAMLKARKQ